MALMPGQAKKISVRVTARGRVRLGVGVSHYTWPGQKGVHGDDTSAGHIRVLRGGGGSLPFIYVTLVIVIRAWVCVEVWSCDSVRVMFK